MNRITAMARATLFAELRYIQDYEHPHYRLHGLIYRASGMIDIAHDIGAITLSTAERCSDWVLAYAERKGITI